MKRTKWLALGLCGALLLAALTACSADSGQEEETVSPTPEETESVSTTPAAEEEDAVQETAAPDETADAGLTLAFTLLDADGAPLSDASLQLTIGEDQADYPAEEDGTLTLEALVETGAQPDMVTFAGDGVVLTADEGEPREGYGEDIADPKGSVTVVDVEAQESTVVDFSAFDSQRDQLAEDGIVLKKGSAPSVDLEPEYIAVSGGKAYVTLQENNAIAVLDIESQAFEGVYSAGFEDHSTTAIDLDKKDDAYDPQTYESLLGIRMPDGIAAFTVEGTTYLVTANEGDAREWGDEDQGTFYLSEDERDFGEEGVTSPTGAITAENSGLEGKVVFFKTEDFDGLDPEKDYVFGGRSFTVFQATENGLEEVFTSGDDFEALTAQYVPEYFNASNDNAVLDDRSGKKGPEAESVTVGTVDGKTYAFVALERTGGVMAYDVTDPAAITFVNYVNTRDFGTTVEGSEEYEDGELDKWVTGGDVAPEGLLFLDAASSPNGEPLLLAACEVSGTVAVYQLGSEDLTVLPFTDVDSDDWFYDGAAYVTEQLDRGLIDFGLIFGPVDSAKYEALTLPERDVWGVLMRRDQPLAAKESVSPEDLWDKPLIISAQKDGSWPVFAWLRRDVSRLNVVATYNLVFNASLLTSEGLGYTLCFDRLVSADEGSGLCFRPFSPRLEAEAALIWRKYQLMSRPAARFLEELRRVLERGN